MPGSHLSSLGQRLAACLVIVLASRFPSMGKSLTVGLKDARAEPVFAAKVFLLPHLQTATASDADGMAHLDIPEAWWTRDTLCVRFLSCQEIRLPLSSLGGDSLVWLTLREDPFFLHDIVLEENPRTGESFSLEKLDRMDIYLSPAAGADPLKAVMLLPSATNGDESAHPQFRGSAATASQVLVNGVALPRPTRNNPLNGVGSFSLLNTELVGDMCVYAGNPPLNYGNSTAGLTDIRTPSFLDQAETQVSLSLASVGALRLQPLGKSPNRKRHFLQLYGNHQFSAPYLFCNPGCSYIEGFRNTDLGLNWHLGRGQWATNYYLYALDERFTGQDASGGQRIGSRASGQRLFQVGNLRYQARRCLLEADGGYHLAGEDYRFGPLEGNILEQQWSLRLSARFLVSDRLYIEAGLSSEGLSSDLKRQEPRYAWTQDDSATTLRRDTLLRGVFPEVFALLHWEKGPFIVGLGSRYKPDTKNLPQDFAWQANLRFTPGRRQHSLLLSAGKYYGYSRPTALDAHIRATGSRQYALEYRFERGNTRATAALYLKQEKGPVYLSHLYDSYSLERRTEGLELSVQQLWGNFKGELSLSSLRSVFASDSLGRTESDMPFLLKARLGHSDDRQRNVSLSLIWRSGLPYTPVIGGEWHEESGTWRPRYGEPYSRRLNAYLSLDLSVNKVYSLGRGHQLIAFISLTNLLNRNNPAGELYTPDYSRQVGYYYLNSYQLYFGLQWRR